VRTPRPSSLAWPWKRSRATAVASGGEGAIRLFHVSKSYSAGSFALRDVSIELAKGEFVFLTGPSGAGKTTLLKLLFGAERPNEGQIVVLGRNIARLGEAAVPPLRQRIGVIFQDFKLLPRRTVEENVALALQVTGTPPREIRARVFAVLKQLGLQHRRYHYPLSLSGGEQQRVGIARAFANQPVVLFADEPTGNLDRATGEEIVRLIFDLNRQHGTTLVIVTHDLELSRRAHRIVHLAGGCIERIEDLSSGHVRSAAESGTGG